MKSEDKLYNYLKEVEVLTIPCVLAFIVELIISKTKFVAILNNITSNLGICIALLIFAIIFDAILGKMQLDYEGNKVTIADGFKILSRKETLNSVANNNRGNTTNSKKDRTVKLLNVILVFIFLILKSSILNLLTFIISFVILIISAFRKDFYRVELTSVTYMLSILMLIIKA